ncbi:MAG: hypothetical protein P8X50_04455 [Maritimibacter sp.]
MSALRHISDFSVPISIATLLIFYHNDITDLLNGRKVALISAIPDKEGVKSFHISNESGTGMDIYSIQCNTPALLQNGNNANVVSDFTIEEPFHLKKGLDATIEFEALIPRLIPAGDVNLPYTNPNNGNLGETIPCEPGSDFGSPSFEFSGAKNNNFCESISKSSTCELSYKTIRGEGHQEFTTSEPIAIYSITSHSSAHDWLTPQDEIGDYAFGISPETLQGRKLEEIKLPSLGASTDAETSPSVEERSD